MAGLSQLAPAEGLFASLTRLFSKLTKGGGDTETHRGGGDTETHISKSRQRDMHTDILAI